MKRRTLGKGDHFRITEENGMTTVRYRKNGKIYQKICGGNDASADLCGYGEEMFMIDGEKTLLRRGSKLTII